jgi:hypothetical protein
MATSEKQWQAIYTSSYFHMLLIWNPFHIFPHFLNNCHCSLSSRLINHNNKYYTGCTETCFPRLYPLSRARKNFFLQPNTSKRWPTGRYRKCSNCCPPPSTLLAIKNKKLNTSENNQSQVLNVSVMWIEDILHTSAIIVTRLVIN